MSLDNIDLILYVALVVDLYLKHRRYTKVKKMMPRWKRYQYNTTRLKYVLYALILIMSVGYLGYRLFGLITGNIWHYPKVMILIPAIDYYVLWDLLYHGIYYNNKSIYYKSELYEFRRATHIYRDLVKDHYEYEMIYRNKEGGIRNVYLRIPNEKEAFELLSVIPFEEE